LDMIEVYSKLEALLGAHAAEIFKNTLTCWLVNRQLVATGSGTGGVQEGESQDTCDSELSILVETVRSRCGTYFGTFESSDSDVGARFVRPTASRCVSQKSKHYLR
jgi:hypothetical protein